MRVMRKYTHITRIENCRYKNPAYHLGAHMMMMDEVSEL